MSHSKDADYKERTCSFLAAGGQKRKKKKESNDLGRFDGKQMCRPGLTFRLDAKLLLQRLVCVGVSSGKLAISFFSTVLHSPVHSALSTSSLPFFSHSHHLLPYDSEECSRKSKGIAER